MEYIEDLNGGFSVIENIKVSGAREGKYGVSIILCPDSTAAAVFTSNKVVAAPVKYTKNVLKKLKVGKKIRYQVNYLNYSAKYTIKVNGNEYETFTISSITTTIGNYSGVGGNPGRPGGPRR